jgi:hypothetical protein
MQETIKHGKLILQWSVMSLYNGAIRKQVSTTTTTKRRIERNSVMALIQINAKVFCLMALLMISTSFLSSQASGRKIGTFPPKPIDYTEI